MKIGRKKRRNSARAAVLLIIAVMILLSVAAFVANGAFYRPQRSAENAAAYLDGGKTYTFLLTGQDRSAKLADVIMLASFNTESHEIRVLQIPRDTYFNYTDKNYKKINGALAKYGDAATFSSKIGEALGIPVDFYISLDLEAFVKIVDMMGGVEVNVPCDMEYNDPYQDLSVRLSAGVQTLDGRTAMQFVRFRSGYIRGDISRMDAQKIFLASVAKKMMATRNPVTLYNIFKTVSNNLETNLSEKDFLFFAYHFLRSDSGDICFVTAPGEDIQSEVSGAWYYILSKSSMTELSQKLFGCENFDKNTIFVDKNVKSFYDIYNKYCPYKIYRAEEIMNGGIELK